MKLFLYADAIQSFTRGMSVYTLICLVKSLGLVLNPDNEDLKMQHANVIRLDRLSKGTSWLIALF
jgi:hypothetical protein